MRIVVSIIEDEERKRKPVHLKLYAPTCLADTLGFAESLGWKCMLANVMDTTDPDDIDAAEADALDYIRGKNYTIREEVHDGLE